MSTVKSLAEEMSRAFERRKRNDDQEFVTLKDGSPQWMTDVCHHAHGDMLPDDWRYEFIEMVVDNIAELSDLDEARSNFDEIYTHRRTGWLHSRVDRYGYVDRAVEDYGSEVRPILDALLMGMATEYEEVFGLVVQKLEELADEDDEADVDS